MTIGAVAFQHGARLFRIANGIAAATARRKSKHRHDESWHAQTRPHRTLYPQPET
jgi:hypothetical protein